MYRVFVCLFWVFNALMALLFIELFYLKSPTTDELENFMLFLRFSLWSGGLALLSIVGFLLKNEFFENLFWSFNLLMALFLLDFYFPIIPRKEDLLGLLLLFRLVVWMGGASILGVIVWRLKRKAKKLEQETG